MTLSARPVPNPALSTIAVALAAGLSAAAGTRLSVLSLHQTGSSESFARASAGGVQVGHVSRELSSPRATH